MPFGACNQLYFDCIHIAYPLATMAKYLHLLLPGAVFYVTPEFNVIDGDYHNVELKLVKKPLKTLDERFSPERLSDFVQADDIIFDVKDIQMYDFKRHQEFFQRINQDYPALAKLIYEHNSDLKTLGGYLHMISDKGQTLLEVFNQFINELRCGGEKITGQTFASTSASIAVVNFFSYIDLLPADIKDNLLAFHTMDHKKKLSDVLNDFKNLECVETAADHLDDIITHQKALNKSILYQTPKISNAVYDVLREQYKQGAFVSSVREQTNNILPSYYLKQLDERLSIKEMPDIIMALLSFPTHMYSFILKNIVDNLQDETVCQLANIMNTGIFSLEQIDAIYDTLLLNMYHYDSDNVLALAIATNAIGIISKLFEKKNEEERFSFLQNLDGINSYLPPLEMACRHPLILKTLMDFLTPENQKRLIQETLLLCYATQNHETLTMIYELYPKEVCSDSITNDKNNDFWYLLVQNTHSLGFILSRYTADEISELCQTETNFAYFLSHAFEYPSSLQLILPLYHPDRLINLILNSYYDNEKTMRYFLYNNNSDENQQSFKMLMSVLPEEQRTQLIFFREKNGGSLLHDSVKCDKKFIELMSYFSNKGEFFPALNVKDNCGLTVIHNLLINNPMLLEKLFKIMPNMPWFSAFQEKNYSGNTLIKIILSNHVLMTAVQSMLSSMPLDLRFIFLSEQDIKKRVETLEFLHSNLSFIFSVDKETKNSLDVDVLLKGPLLEATKETQRELLIKYLTYPDSSRPLTLLLDYLFDIVGAEEIFAWASIENNLYPAHYALLSERCSKSSPLMIDEHIPAPAFFSHVKSKRDREEMMLSDESEPKSKRPKSS